VKALMPTLNIAKENGPKPNEFIILLGSKPIFQK
jgi:hypothetical protein